MKRLTNMTLVSYTETLPNGFSFDMIFVEGGTFRMRTYEIEPADTSKTPLVKVRSFYIGKYPVTQGLWKAVMGEENNPSFFQGDDRPVEDIGWMERKKFFEQLIVLTGKKYQIPSEIQWEYAAKGGKFQQGFKYAGSDNLDEVAWFDKNSHGESKPVGMKAPNELGLYDMSGNVWESCTNWFDKCYMEYWDGVEILDEDFKKCSDPVLRSAGWDSPPRFLGVERPGWDEPYLSENALGFRLVLPIATP